MDTMIRDLLAKIVPAQYREDPIFMAIVNTIGKELDLVVQAIQEEALISDLDSCSGVLLDLWGELCCEPRGNKNDAEYKKILKLVFQNPISGTPDEIMRELAVRHNAVSVTYSPEYPAGFWCTTTGYDMTQDEIESYAPAGVQAIPGCILVDAYGDHILFGAMNPDDVILVVGPCPAPVYPTDTTWDGGQGDIDPASFVFTEAWPFRDSSGLGQYPDGGTGDIDTLEHSFADETFADMEYLNG